jgi:signal transduction histidine kinase
MWRYVVAANDHGNVTSLSGGKNSHVSHQSDSHMTAGSSVLAMKEAQKRLLEVEVQTLSESLRLQRSFNSHLLAIREEERTIIAREIQDELGQMLASLKVNVSLIAEEYRDHSRLVSRVQAMEQLITTSIMTVQRISSQLRPVMLDILGITEALEWQSKEFEKKAGIKCKTIILLREKKVKSELASAVYRICEEALNNVIHHSGARTVRVILLERKSWLTLSVSDDGRGITDKEKNDGHSFGIAGMRGWAEAFGGRLRISGSPLRGTGVFARIPTGMQEGKI